TNCAAVAEFDIVVAGDLAGDGGVGAGTAGGNTRIAIERDSAGDDGVVGPESQRARDVARRLCNAVAADEKVVGERSSHIEVGLPAAGNGDAATAERAGVCRTEASEIDRGAAGIGVGSAERPTVAAILDDAGRASGAIGNDSRDDLRGQRSISSGQRD